MGSERTEEGGRGEGEDGVREMRERERGEDRRVRGGRDALLRG